MTSSISSEARRNQTSRFPLNPLMSPFLGLILAALSAFKWILTETLEFAADIKV